MVATRLPLVTTFALAAWKYWITVFPIVTLEALKWRDRAYEIPDPALRRLALEAQTIKRGNIEGAAAFAAFAPHLHRRAIIRAQVAFQSIYDYVDTLAEQPSANPVHNGAQLHQALLAALGDETACDYYTHHTHHHDGGYLQQIVNACKDALETLPARAAITGQARALAHRIVAYQSMNLTRQQGGHRALRHWARREAPSENGLRWWETAASAGSSLGIFALIAAAAQPSLSPSDAAQIASAYWPWIGALHSLLDSVVDYAEDTAADQTSLLDYYQTNQEAAKRLIVLAQEGLRRIHKLPNEDQHTTVLIAMICHYLSDRRACVSPITDEVLDTVDGTLTKAAISIFRVRHRWFRGRIAFAPR